MQYALLHRFQGSLLGAALGEILGLRSQENPQVPIRLSATQPTLDLHSLTQLCLQNLLQSHSSEEWERRSESFTLADLSASEVTGKAAIALLPIALFFHENRLLLWDRLSKAAVSLHQSQLDLHGVFAVGEAIAEILQEKLHPLTFIPQLLATLEALDDIEEVPLIQSLQQVQGLLKQQVGLDKVLERLERPLAGNSNLHRAIPLALYCFLSTPEDFRLSVLRAARSPDQPAVVCALTGALSGAYNSVSGMEIEWRLAASQWRLASGEVLSQSELLNQASHLLENWSGVYTPAVSQSLIAAVAAPQVIRKFG